MSQQERDRSGNSEQPQAGQSEATLAPSPSRSRLPLMFKDASKLEAQPSSPKQGHADAGEDVEEEDAPEAVMGCDRMVHRTLSRTSLNSHKKLRKEKSSRSIHRLDGNPSSNPGSRKGSFIGSLKPSRPRSTKSTKEDDDIAGKDEKGSSGNSNEDEQIKNGNLSPTTEDNDENKVHLIDWEGPDDPENPKNWSFKRKWAATAITSAFTFISPVSSSMLAPVSDRIAQEFGVTSTVTIAMITSIFVLAYAFGPLFLAPISEVYGRSRVLQFANLLFLVFNLACGFSRNTAQILVFRFLSGLGGSAPLAVGGGVLGDCWRPEERGAAIAVYSLAPLVGPAIGPVIGAWIGLRSTWRWVLWSVTITDAVIQIAGIFFLQETFAPVLLERKAHQLCKSMGIPRNDPRRALFKTPYDTEGQRHWRTIFGRALTRPFLMFIREPIIQLLGLYQAFMYGLMYLVLTTIPSIFQGTYHESIGIAGLHYIALGAGLSIASQINARMLDQVYKYLKDKYGGIGKPEYRLPSMIPGTIILPVGLFIFGWTAEKHVFWLVPDIGIAMIGGGVILNFQAITTYVIDAFTLHAASGIAATAFLRSLCGFIFPLFAPAMYNALGFGLGDTVLAIAGIVLGCPAPYLFWIYGERLRLRSRYGKRSNPEPKTKGNNDNNKD